MTYNIFSDYLKRGGKGRFALQLINSGTETFHLVDAKDLLASSKMQLIHYSAFLFAVTEVERLGRSNTVY